MPGMEPRMRPRPPGPFFADGDIATILYGNGDDPHPLPETIRVMDQILVDFIIELCYEAEAHAAHSNRVKIKADDFTFAIRHKGRMLGRTVDMFSGKKAFDKMRKHMNLDEGKVVKSALNEDGVPTGPGRGRKRKGADEEKGEEGEDGEKDFEANSERGAISLKSGKSGKVGNSKKAKSGASAATLD